MFINFGFVYNIILVKAFLLKLKSSSHNTPVREYRMDTLIIREMKEFRLCLKREQNIFVTSLNQELN